MIEEVKVVVDHQMEVVILLNIVDIIPFLTFKESFDDGDVTGDDRGSPGSGSSTNGSGNSSSGSGSGSSTSGGGLASALQSEIKRRAEKNSGNSIFQPKKWR